MSSPFVHLLRTIYGYYFFDVNTNQIVCVQQDVYKLLEDILARPEQYEDYRQLEILQPLLNEGLLSDKHVKKIKHSATDRLSLYLNRRMESVTLQVTQQCNLRCSYCIYSNFNNALQRTHSNKTMSWDVAKRSIDFLMEHSIDNHRVNIAFYGGEPFLNYKLIKQVVEYIQERYSYKTVTYALTTNGTILTDEIIAFLIDNNVSMTVSLDGGEEIHDVNRRFAANGKGSYQAVKRNVEKLVNEHPEYMEIVPANMVVSATNDYDQINSFHLNKEDLFDHVAINVNQQSNMYSSRKDASIPEYSEKSAYQKFLALVNALGIVPNVEAYPTAKAEVGSLLSMVENKVRQAPRTIELPDEAHPSGPCIAGQHQTLIDVDGNFLPCEKVSELSEAMKIGNVYDGFNEKQIEALLNVGRLTEDLCKDCWAFVGCILCVQYAENQNQLSGAIRAHNCRIAKNTFEEQLYTAILIDELKHCY